MSKEETIENMAVGSVAWLRERSSLLEKVIKRAQHHIDDADNCCGVKLEDRTNENDLYAVTVKSIALNLLRVAKGESGGCRT